MIESMFMSVAQQLSLVYNFVLEIVLSTHHLDQDLLLSCDKASSASTRTCSEASEGLC